VPYRHDRDLRRDELSNFLRQAGISREEFFRLLAGEELTPEKWNTRGGKKEPARVPAPDG